MARGLKYPANCYYCNKRCDPKEEKHITHKSFLQRQNGKWYAHCYPCYKKKKELDNKN